jgi:hypothetical protein
MNRGDDYVMLCIGLGMSRKEIATQMKTNVTRVRQREVRALRRARAAVKEFEVSRFNRQVEAAALPAILNSILSDEA